MRRLRHDQDGYVMIAAIVILLITILLGTAAITAGVSALSVAGRGRYDTQAEQAAEAAAELAYNRINLMNIDSLGLSASTPCLAWSSNGTVTAVAASSSNSSWCPTNIAYLPQVTDGNAYYQYSLASSGTRNIVGTATVGSVTRRAMMTVATTGTTSYLFGNYAVESHAAIYLGNQTQITGGGVRSDGNITLDGTAAPGGCHVTTGPISYGYGMSSSTGFTNNNNSGMCGLTPAAEGSTIPFPAITIPSSNNDGNLCNNGDACSGTVTWNSLNLSLTLQNTGDTVTLTGNVYVFCNLTMNNGTLKLSPRNGQPVQIYFPAPGSTQCPKNTSGQQVLTVQNNTAWIDNLTGLGAKGLQIFIAGNNTSYLNNQASTVINGTIYAPSATISIINQGSIKGAVSANAVTMTANGSIAYDSTASSVGISSGSSQYAENKFSECTPTGTAAAPNTGC